MLNFTGNSGSGNVVTQLTTRTHLIMSHVVSASATLHCHCYTVIVCPCSASINHYSAIQHVSVDCVIRYAVECEPPEWKERGTGDVRIMKKEENQSARILMRREKTLKVCANHHITPWMDMKRNCGSKKAWVWKTQADFADEEPKQEVSVTCIYMSLK